MGVGELPLLLGVTSTLQFLPCQDLNSENSTSVLFEVTKKPSWSKSLEKDLTIVGIEILVSTNRIVFFLLRKSIHFAQNSRTNARKHDEPYFPFLVTTFRNIPTIYSDHRAVRSKLRKVVQIWRLSSPRDTLSRF